MPLLHDPLQVQCKFQMLFSSNLNHTYETACKLHFQLAICCFLLKQVEPASLLPLTSTAGIIRSTPNAICVIPQAQLRPYLNGCQESLIQGCYTWCHDLVLNRLFSNGSNCLHLPICMVIFQHGEHLTPHLQQSPPT